MDVPPADSTAGNWHEVGAYLMMVCELVQYTLEDCAAWLCGVPIVEVPARLHAAQDPAGAREGALGSRGPWHALVHMNTQHHQKVVLKSVVWDMMLLDYPVCRTC